MVKALATGKGVLIAGGGIGGLAFGLALARRGIASHILERRRAYSEEGAGIQIGPNGTRILRELGVAEALRPYAGKPDFLIVRDAITGGDVAQLPLNATMQERFGSPYWVVHREDLHAALLTQARVQPLISITMGAAVQRVSSTGEGATVETEDGDLYEGDVVVGADGARSAVRQAVAGPSVYVPNGKSAYRCVVPAKYSGARFPDGNTRIWLTKDAHFVHYAVRDRSEMAVIAILDDTAFTGTGWSHEGDPDPVFRRMTLAPELSKLLSKQRWRRWALSSLEALPPMASGRIALLGDAAHPILPFLAQGGVMALEDAVVLADCLATFRHDVAGALDRYRHLREPRVHKVAEASKMNGQIYHLSGLVATARNLVMRWTPGHKLMKAYDWLYGWKQDVPPHP